VDNNNTSYYIQIKLWEKHLEMKAMETSIKEVAKEATMKKKLGEAISFLLNDYIKRKIALYLSLDIWKKD